jgi:hypothetical protein
MSDLKSPSTDIPTASLELDPAYQFIFGGDAREVIVTSLAEYVALNRRTGLIYRGHSDAGWLLEPSLIRLSRTHLVGIPESQLGEIEADLLQRFISAAPMLLAHVPTSIWEWLVLAQHHGVPTRLLDWSTNSLVALYFAVEPYDCSHDAAVWQYYPDWRSLLRPADGNPIQTLSMSHIAELRQFSVGAQVRPMHPRHVDPRIRVQNSVFTVHPIGVPSEVASKRLRKVIIPRDFRHAIRTELNQVGIHGGSVFPDLDGLARQIKEWLYTLLG